MPSEKDKRELVTKMTAHVRKRFGGTGLDAWRRAFDAADRNHDGAISKPELEAMLKAAGIGNFITIGAWTDGVMRELDKGQNGTLTFEELKSALVSTESAEPIPWSVPPEPTPEPIRWSAPPEPTPEPERPMRSVGPLLFVGALLLLLRR